MTGILDKRKLEVVNHVGQSSYKEILT